jgi:tRNA(fMet)-specific endonuclease VapC
MRPDEIALSIVTVEEMLRGRLAILARRSEGDGRVHAYTKLLEAVRFFGTIPVVPFDRACEQQFQMLRALRLRVGSRDLRIAATALVQNVVLITRNRRDFERVPGLMLDDWSV